jgi:hypothetical protein
MVTVAYLANQFPCAVEPYVGEEIEELRRRGVRVVAGSVRSTQEIPRGACTPEIVLQALNLALVMQAIRLIVRRWSRISDVIHRVTWLGNESPLQRLKALTHTLLGACYAILLEEYELEHKRIDHIHVHHGYFGSWDRYGRGSPFRHSLQHDAARV